VVWRFQIEISWGKGHGAMPQRGRLCGDQWWKVNMTACGAGSAPMRLSGLMGLGYGKSLGGDGASFPNL